MSVAPPGLGRTVEQILADTARITDPALRRVVDGLPSPLRESIYYHYGWAGKDGGPATGVRGGTGRKGIAFTLLCAGVDGGPVERALPAVVAGNLLMNVATLHDDIIDLEAQRRGRPTVLAAYTTGHAIMAGDALLALAFAHLGEHPHPGPGRRWPSRARAGASCARARSATRSTKATARPASTGPSPCRPPRPPKACARCAACPPC